MDLRTKICRCLTKIGSKKCVNGAWRLRTSAYTLAHKMAFSDYEKCLTGRHTLAGRLHDCDKLFLYMLPWLNKKQIQVYHHKHQPHHMEYPQYKVAHLVQSYIDWECAAVTKPDKPLDAFATLHTELLLHILTLALLQSHVVDIRDTRSYREIDVKIKFFTHDRVGSDSDFREKSMFPSYQIPSR